MTGRGVWGRGIAWYRPRGLDSSESAPNQHVTAVTAQNHETAGTEQQDQGPTTANPMSQAKLIGVIDDWKWKGCFRVGVCGMAWY